MLNELEIEAVTGREILDSRGNPTVEVEVCLAGQLDARPFPQARPRVNLRQWN